MDYTYPSLEEEHFVELRRLVKYGDWEYALLLDNSQEDMESRKCISI